MTAEHRAISNALLEATLGIGTHGLPVSTDEPAVVDICPHRRRRHGSEPCYFDEDGQCWSSGEDGFPGACPGRRARTPRARPAQVYDNFSCSMTFNGMEIPLEGISVNDATFAQQDRETDQEFRTRQHRWIAHGTPMPGTRGYLIEGIMGLRFGANTMAPLDVQIDEEANGETVVRVAVDEDVNHHNVEGIVSDWLYINGPDSVRWVVMAEYPNPNTGEAPFANLATATGEDLDRLNQMAEEAGVAQWEAAVDRELANAAREYFDGERCWPAATFQRILEDDPVAQAAVQRLRERRQGAEETGWLSDDEDGVPFNDALEAYQQYVAEDIMRSFGLPASMLSYGPDVPPPLNPDRPALLEDPRTGAMVPRSRWADVMAQEIDEQEEGEY